MSFLIERFFFPLYFCCVPFNLRGQSNLGLDSGRMKGSKCPCMWRKTYRPIVGITAAVPCFVLFIPNPHRICSVLVLPTILLTNSSHCAVVWRCPTSRHACPLAHTSKKNYENCASHLYVQFLSVLMSTPPFLLPPSAFLRPTPRRRQTRESRRREKAKSTSRKRKSCTPSTSLSEQQQQQSV